MGADDGQCPDRSPHRGLQCTKRVGHLLPHMDGVRRIVWDNAISETMLPEDAGVDISPPGFLKLAIDQSPDAVDLVNRIRTAGGLARLMPGLAGKGHPSGLASWWRKQAETEIERTVPKAEEYGSTDLIRVGRIMAESAGRHGVSDEEAAELGVFFYIEGKLARWADAVTRGERVSDDTLFDIGIYVRMAQRIRATGGWPTGSKGAK